MQILCPAFKFGLYDKEDAIPIFTGGVTDRIRSMLIHSRLITKYGITVPAASEIGIGLTIPHPSSITISSYYIGKNFHIYQNTTVGIKERGTAPPKIGNDETLYANSSVIGNITVSDNATVGANSLLLCNAAEGGIYVGTPAKNIKE